MPTYHARGVSARLGTLPLSDAITRNTVAKKGETARQQAEAAEKKLRRSKLLPEQSVPFPGDNAGFGLNWLGDAPFMQAQIAQTNNVSVFAGACDPGDKVDDNCRPEALVLHVQLSNRTFVTGLDKAKTSLKIDVFFNGELASCVFIPIHDVRSGAKPLHQVFAGTRVDYLSERPWVILHTRTSSVSAEDHAVAPTVEQRWQDICQALQHEAQARGTDLNGNIAPSAGFLEALAAMQMPRHVHDMQRPNGRYFGVIDVVITAGDGRKTTNGAGYLKTPKRLVDDNFPLNVDGSNTKKEARVVSIGITSSIAPDPLPCDLDAEGESDSDFEPQAKRQALTPRVLSMYQTPVVSNPFSGTQTPLLPLPARMSLIGSPLAVQRHTSQASSPPIEFDQGQIPQAGSSRRRYTNDHTPRTLEEGQILHGAILQSNSHDVQSGLAVSGPKPTPPVCMSPWDFWENRPMLQQATHSDPAGFVPFSKGHRSGPLQRIGSDPYGPLQLLSSSPSVLSLYDFRQHGDMYEHPVCTMPKEGERRASNVSDRVGSIPVHDFQSESRLENFTAAPVAPMFPRVRPTRPPHTPHPTPYYPSAFPVNLSFLPYNTPARAAPAPPTALFSVPAKPKINVGLDKTKCIKRPVKSRKTFFVTRLVLYGRNGPVLDHRWTNPQRLSLGPGDMTVGGHTDDYVGKPHKQFNDHPRGTVRTTVVLPSEQDTSQPGPVGLSSNLHSSTNGAINEVEVEGVAEQNTVKTCEDSEPKSNPFRHAVSGSGILGIQGPKATTFWLDDPEEILRRASTQRRSKSPIKRKGSFVKPTRPKAFSAQSSVPTNTASSSPLSSAPTTPEPVVDLVPHTPVQPILQRSRRSEPCMPQADGPSENAAAHLPIPSTTATAPSDNLYPTMPQQSVRLKLTPAALQSLNTRKRKAPTQSVTKTWRNHDRIIDVSDPPLNKNCVIAYADSETAEAKLGPLRQVKSERQGVFREEYVVFAARFFVPRN
ncbi:hypothetical protein T440DRAFT_307902 [Plenodomus tracheiphilus IPT5]|uniref:Uncharacterized protein n=1 Tax=Plenodomus tracheiphilus IPT5 TaxID=1408161 RepID=A0A6A7BFP3_9PLEO|nr:hypothetical protein T440DRAFT_307902 [Plenodomus tracheiphilus IPT5]